MRRFDFDTASEYLVGFLFICFCSLIGLGLLAIIYKGLQSPNGRFLSVFLSLAVGAFLYGGLKR